MDSNFTDITVLYQNSERVDQAENSDNVVIGTESLIHTNVRSSKYGFRCMNVCCNQNASSRTRVVAGTVLFVTGLAVGLLIGRLSVNCEESSHVASIGNDGELETIRNCTSFCSDNFTSTASHHPSTTSPPSTHRQSVTMSRNDSIVTTSGPNTCVPCNDSSVKQTTSPPPTSSVCKTCQTRNPDVSNGNETLLSVFAPLTVDEVRSANHTIWIKLNMTFQLPDDIYHERISHIYLYPTPKDAAIRYLDKNGTFPGRFAKVHVIRGSRSPPDIMEYKVGPLNVSYKEMSVVELRKDGEIVFNRRPFDMAELYILYRFISPHLEKISELLRESFDGVYYKNGTYPSFSFQPSSNISDRTSHVVLVLNLNGTETLGLLPVSCTVHHPGTNETLWYTNDWYYNSNGPFSNANELQSAYSNGSIPRLKFSTNYTRRHEREFALIRNETLPYRILSEMPPPRTYEPQGPRYTVSGHKVTWMGWQLDISSDPIRGPAIFDVRFLGERIAYEISLQDITLLYSSQTNGHGPYALSDTFYLIGSYHKPVKNVDCPERGYVLNASRFFAGTQKTEEAFCIFEADGQTPLWRHAQSGLADHYLVVRAALNLDNYDYILEWNFHLDGRLKTMLTASGYLYGAFWDASDTKHADDMSFSPLGYKLGEHLQGPIHDHTYTFKVDLDVLGSSNSFETIHWKTGSADDVFQKQFNATSTPKYFIFNTTRYLMSEILRNESSFIIDPKNPKVWTVVNEDKRNHWGSRRGYRIIPQTKFAEILQDHVMLKPWEQLKFQLAVSQRKDSEPYATNSIYELTHPDAPSISGKMKLNKENVRNEDLVVWLSEKFYHVPSSEDVPMTLPAQTGFTLKPFNYFDRTPTFDLRAHYSATDPYPSEACYENT